MPGATAPSEIGSDVHRLSFESGPVRAYCRLTAAGAQPTDGTATLGLTGVEIDIGHGHPRRIWRYGNVRTLEPLRPNAIDALLSSSEEAGVRLFVQGPEFAAGLRERAPHLTARAERMRRLRPWLIAFATIAALAGFIVASGWSPVKLLAARLPEPWRDRLGDMARASMTEGHNQCVDTAGTAALARMTDRLSNVANVTSPFHVRVYDWPLMNAFAVPGGQIVLTRGLLEKAQDPDEVAGVLAHEMGHGIEMHPETSIIRSIGLAAAVQIMLGGLDESGGLTNVGLMLAQLGYTRGAEREADRHAIKLLHDAAISPKGLGNFFTRVSKIEEGDRPGVSMGGPMTWLRTHPPAAERAKLVRAQPDYKSTPALDARAWHELQAICSRTISPEQAEKAEKADKN